MKPILYMQNGKKYGSYNYSAKGEHKTIASSGCGVTCAAMAIQTLRPDKKVTPITTANWSMAHGYKALNQGTYYTYFVPQFKEYGLECERLNTNSIYHTINSPIHDIAKARLKAGNMIIACMGKGNWTSAGHYILVYMLKDGYVYINDPASTASNRTKAKWSVFANDVKYYFSISMGDKVRAKLNGNLYKNRDIKKGKFSTIVQGVVMRHIYDCGDGWSICYYNDNIGFVKNSIIDNKFYGYETVGKLSGYKMATVSKKASLRKNNNKASKKIETVPIGVKVKVITKRKYWTNVVVNGRRGYIATSKLIFK